MRIEIAFNRDYNNKETQDLLLEVTGGTFDYEKDSGYGGVFVEMKTFEQLEEMLKKLDEKTGDMYSAIVSFDSPTIFFDKD